MINSKTEKPTYVAEKWTKKETIILRRHFTNLDKPVFGLIHLPEVVKGALFARYSRTHKSIRRLFLDEFYEEIGGDGFDVVVSTKRANELYKRVFDEYGDDSVAQLTGAHMACEQVSNVCINSIEWHRLMAYLEQSTRYIDYSVPLPDGRYRYRRDPEILSGPHAQNYLNGMNRMFELYKQVLGHAIKYFKIQNPRDSFDGDDTAYRNTIRAKSFDTVRTMLPAGIVSNLGIYGTAQSYQRMLTRMFASDLAENREFASMMLEELRHPQMVSALMNQVDMPERGLAAQAYERDTRSSAQALVASSVSNVGGLRQTSKNHEVLLYCQPGNEIQVMTAIIYDQSGGRFAWEQANHLANQLNSNQQRVLIEAYVGERGNVKNGSGNRRWKPGRAFEFANYELSFCTDFGIFRDLKRHRMLTLCFQPLSIEHGWVVSPFIEDMGQSDIYREAMDLSAELYLRLQLDHPLACQYAIALGYRMRYAMSINARALMHMLELRTIRQGHPTYRRVCQEVHRQLASAEPVIAAAMSHVDFNEYDLERAEAEKRISVKRAKRAT